MVMGMTAKRFYIQDERVIKDTKKYITENGYVLSFKNDAEELCDLLNTFVDENEQLKQELFESEFDYIMETYANNPVRRDDKIESLKKEFKERFGRDFEYD